MIEKYFGAKLPKADLSGELGNSLRDEALKLPGIVDEHMKELKIPEALQSIWQLID